MCERVATVASRCHRVSLAAPTVASVRPEGTWRVVTPRTRIEASDLLGLLERVRAALASAQAEVDALNVFPVPDGDTGTNLYLTFEAARAALSDADPQDEVTAWKVLSRGALLGARGNSGVILSQLLRASAQELAGAEELNAADLAREAVVMGFAEVQFDYLRFPDEPRWLLDRAVFPGKRPGESQRAAVRRNVALMRERTADLGVPFTLDLFGLTTSADGDLGIGQTWEDLAPLADVVLPMVYPSHYRRGAYGIQHPNASPYATVRLALEDGLRKNALLASPPKIRPYLQAFSIFRVRYTPEEIRAQIRAAEELGITDWVLWNARGVYPSAALRPGLSRSSTNGSLQEAGFSARQPK